MREPCAVKVARTVPRGLGGSNAPQLPDQPTLLSSLVLRLFSLLVRFVFSLAPLRKLQGG